MSPSQSLSRPGQRYGEQRRKHGHAGDRTKTEQDNVEQAHDRVLYGRSGQDDQGR